jgi:hypothetical protein
MPSPLPRQPSGDRSGIILLGRVPERLCPPLKTYRVTLEGEIGRVGEYLVAAHNTAQRLGVLEL